MYVPQRRKEDGFLKRLLGFFKWYLIMAGAMVTLTSVVAIVSLSRGSAGASLPDKMILTYTFKKDLLEIPDPSFGPSLLHTSATFHEVIEALAKASKDARVKGFVARLRELSLSPAQIQ